MHICFLWSSGYDAFRDLNLRSKFSAYFGHNPWLFEQGNNLLHEIFEVELEEKRVRVCDLKLSQTEKVFC